MVRERLNSKLVPSTSCLRMRNVDIPHTETRSAGDEFGLTQHVIRSTIINVVSLFGRIKASRPFLNIDIDTELRNS